MKDTFTVAETAAGRFRQLEQFLRKFGLLREAIGKFIGDNGFFLSSGIAFNILINLIPLILLLSAFIASYLYNDQAVVDHISANLRIVSPALDSRITQDLLAIIEKRRIVGVLGFVVLVWFSTFVFGSLRIALNIVFSVEKSRKFLHAIGIDLLMILLAGSLFVVSMSISVFASFLQSYRGQILVEIGPILEWILEYILPLVSTCGVFFLVYKVIPNRSLHFETIFQAALFTGLLWELAKHIFAWYIIHLARYSLFYGSFSTLVIFVVWVYYSSMILVLGGEFAYFLEELRQKGDRVPSKTSFFRKG